MPFFNWNTILIIFGLTAVCSAAYSYDLYVSPKGSDLWSGRLSEPNKEGTDGPFASIHAARDAVRAIRQEKNTAEPVRVWIREGRYHLDAPLEFCPVDSNVAYSAYPDEKVVVDGAKAVGGWHAETVNGVKAWVTEITEVKEGKLYFKSLFINNRRCTRARLPKEGFYKIAGVPGQKIGAVDWWNDKSDTFIAADGDFSDFHNLADVDVVVPHFWVAERMPVTHWDPGTRTVKCSQPSLIALIGQMDPTWSKYYIDNVFEGLIKPGQWYLDRKSGKLYYIPMPGEQLDKIEAYAPRLQRLISAVGDPQKQEHVKNLRFQGITFECTDWDYYSKPYATSKQADYELTGAIYFKGAEGCSVEDCRIQHIGNHAIEIAEGCHRIAVVGNEIWDLGGGGIKIGGGHVSQPACLQTSNNFITDNHIHSGGTVFHGAVGILAMHSHSDSILHNEIHDFIYSGISCGWDWTRANQVSRDNRIEKNHIHHLGKGWLGDMGAIYLLGHQPGTVVKGNLIHDIGEEKEMAWGIVLDAFGSYIVIEDNIVYDCNANCFAANCGRETIVRNNIFAFGDASVIGLSRTNSYNVFSMERNILVSNNGPMYLGGWMHDLEDRAFRTDLNILWDVAKPELFSRQGNEGSRVYNIDEWHKLGMDCHSVVADPLFKNLQKRDFTLKSDSPAYSQGFKPIDMSDVGPRIDKVKRMSVQKEPEQLRKLFAGAKPWVIKHKKSRCAEIYMSVAGQDLAIWAKVYDARITPSTSNWQGTKLDVWTAMPGDPLPKTIEFSPGVDGHGKAVLNGSADQAKKVRWICSAMKDSGYEILALVPAADLGVDVLSNCFYFDAGISTVVGPEEARHASKALAVQVDQLPVKYITLFGTLVPVEETWKFGQLRLR